MSLRCQSFLRAIYNLAMETSTKTPSETLRWLYAPYAWLVYFPVVALSTAFLGTLAMFVSLLSPRAAFHVGTFWSWLLCVLNFTSVTMKGRENAARNQSYIIMANHQSHFDIPAFYSRFRRQFRWVLKKELAGIPFLGWYCVYGKHIVIDRSDREKALVSLKNAKSILQNGVSVLFFPEGTRSKTGELQEFKKGGFMMALDLGLPILPVSILGSRRVLPKKSLRLLPGRIFIQVHPPIDTLAVGADGRDSLMEKVRAAIASGLSNQ
jgi:1-acyl-sn-glycerol-3-phosphate acyltransferase